MIQEIIIRVQANHEANSWEYDIYLGDDNYIDCNVADGGVITEFVSFADAVAIAGEHARDYLKLHYPENKTK